MTRRYTIREYEGFTRGVETTVSGLQPLPEKTFDQLERMILLNRAEDGHALPVEFMSLGAKAHIGKVITARNYVGIVAMKDGAEIEILPKTAVTDGPDAIAAERKLLLRMLQTAGEISFKTFNAAHMDVARIPLLELFVQMFLREVRKIARRGFKSGYTTIEENAPCLRGKLLFARHIRANFAHQERLYVAHNVFSANCAENRLIKAALRRLLRFARVPAVRRDLQTLLAVMDAVPESSNLAQDFSLCSCGRSWENYQPVLDWCRIFLSGKSFTNLYGEETALALLFPMETVFERYVAACLRRYLDREKYVLSVQDTGRWLFDAPSKQFRLRPDLVVLDKNNGNPLAVLDTKWKRLSDSGNAFSDSVCKSASQSDIYQALAYQREYGAAWGALLYPGEESGAISLTSRNGNRLQIQTVDLWKPEKIAADIETLCGGSA